MRNKFRALAFLLLLDSILVGSGFLLGGREGLLWLLFISLSINFLLYFYSDTRVLNYLDPVKLGGHNIAGPDGWGVYANVSELAQKMRTPIPQIIKLDLASPQILVTGRSHHRATIIVTDGFLNLLTPTDQKALLTYAMTAIKANLVLVFGMIGSFIAFFEMLFSTIDRCIRFLIGTRAEHWSGHVTQSAFIPVVMLMVRLFLNEREYYLLDLEAKSQLKDSKDLGRGLQKIEAYSHTLPIDAKVSLAHFFVINPLTTRAQNQLLKIQPRTEKRIEKLVGCYPI